MDARIGTVAYRLVLSEGVRIHPVFHASQLCKAIGNMFPITPFPPNMTKDFVLKVEPLELLRLQESPADNSKLEVLIRWTDMDISKATWDWKDVIWLKMVLWGSDLDLLLSMYIEE